MTNNRCVIFTYKGKYAHFLRAEANASAPSYPFPPRTALLGLLGAVMGFKKDSVQTKLENANLAVSGNTQTTHWHTANLRKDPPGLLQYKVKKGDKGSSKNQRNTRITQEWLFRPKFTVYAQIDEPFHSDLCKRLKTRSWYFTPCLGLSEMTADLAYVDCVETEALPSGKYEISTLASKGIVTLDVERIIERNMAAKSIRMPRSLTPDRQFSHAAYVYSTGGDALPVETDFAVKAGENIIQWL